jgi:integrase
MASIQRIKSPLTGEISYRAQVRVKGRPSESASFPNRKEAEQWGGSIEAAIREGRHFPTAKARRTTFAELVERYRTTTLPGMKPKEAATRDRHLRWWADRFEGLALVEVTADRVAEARDALAASTFTRGKPRTDAEGRVIPPKAYPMRGASVNRYLASLSHLLSIAMREWRLIDRNAVADISRKKESRGRTRFLSDDERDRLLIACEKSSWAPLYALVLLAITTGGRRGELVGLKWADVDLKPGRALVHETKNGEPRVLPIVGKALDAIRELKLQGSARSEYVFPQPSGHPGPYENFDSHWYAALAEAGIEGLRFHDLRHTTASYLAAQGASLLEIADVLGHKTLAMVKRYSHLVQGHKATVIEKMAKAKGL